MLSMLPILQYPWFDFPFVYSTDESSVAVGATLLQDQGQGLLLLCYASRELNSAKYQQSIEDREFLAIVFAIVKQRHYLAGGPKLVVCLIDRELLKLLYPKSDLDKWQSRWIEKTVYVIPVIQWLLGKEQVVPDALSLRPAYS